jgi:hypothetical protein
LPLLSIVTYAVDKQILNPIYEQLMTIFTMPAVNSAEATFLPLTVGKFTEAGLAN